MIRKIFFFQFACFFLSCQYNRQLFKEITIGKVGFAEKLTKLSWYRESYITSTRSFIALKIDGKAEENLLICDDAEITDIGLKNDTVFIMIYNLEKAAIYKKRSSFDSYSIILKNSSYEDWFKFYHPGERFHEVRACLQINPPHLARKCRAKAKALGYYLCPAC